jgi:KaiC/GvpD/RAD55 family RecA-like ATPase
MNMNYDEQEVRKAFSIMNDGFTEVRMLRDKMTVSGYFSDADTLLKNMKKYANVAGMNFYMVMNKIEDACYSRKSRDCFVEYPKETTADVNITERQWFLIDMDCERAKGVSSNQEEFDLARKKALDVYKHLATVGFEKPIVAISGNGYHLLYKIFLKCTEKSNALIKDCLLALDEWFSDDRVKIDTTVFNAARITKLYGTMAQKGQSTEDRPHRLSRIIDIPKEIKLTDAAILLKLAEQKTKQEEPPKQQYYGQQSEFNIDDFIRKHNIQITSESRTQGGRRMILDHCPFNPDHNGKDAALFVKDSGGYGFKCLHASCSQNGWKEFRKYYEPDAYTQRTTPRVNSKQPQQPKEIPERFKDEPDWWTAEQVKPVDRSRIVTIKTNIRDLDRRIAGLNKGEVSVVSGLNGSGKTSLLSQITLETINQGYKVALYSGEMKENRIFNWTRLQAAGKQYTIPTEIEGFYEVDNEVIPIINKWLNSSLYLYNNNKGNDIMRILEKTEQVIKEQKADLVILDNLMAMDLSLISGDKYEKQSDFIKKLMQFAPQNDVHIILVAHPRKAMGFLRKDDISGTADLTNAVDNVFIVHRVNNDFKRLSGQMFGWHDGYDLYDYSNVIEVCKNRDIIGTEDLFVGLHYEKESKRFLNEPHEVRHFKWEDSLPKPAYHWEEQEAQLPFDLD